jgi:hypothetical protein
MPYMQNGVYYETGPSGEIRRDPSKNKDPNYIYDQRGRPRGRVDQPWDQSTPAANNGGGGNGANIGGGGANSGGGFVGPEGGQTPLPVFTDFSSLTFPTVNVPYNPIDPQLFAQRYNVFNRGEYGQNFNDALSYAQALLDFEKAGLASYAPDAAKLQQFLASQENVYNQGQIGNANQFNQGQTANANQFNQGQLNQRLQAELPQAREIINERLGSARRLAQGLLPLSLNDRAFELGARSVAADSAFNKGFGNTSTFTRNMIDKYSTGERLALTDRGDARTDQWLKNAITMLVDAPLKYSPLQQQPSLGRLSGDIRGMPSLSPSQLASQQQQQLVNLTQFTTPQAADFQRQQDQFGAGFFLDQQKFNSTGLFNEQLEKLYADSRAAALAYGAAQDVANMSNSSFNQQLALSMMGTGMVGQAGLQYTQAQQPQSPMYSPQGMMYQSPYVQQQPQQPTFSNYGGLGSSAQGGSFTQQAPSTQFSNLWGNNPQAYNTGQNPFDTSGLSNVNKQLQKQASTGGTY